MLNYIRKNNIEFNNIGSVTPNLKQQKYIYLDDDTASFSNKDFNKNEFILYSNIFNDFSDDEVETLQNEWKEVKIYKKSCVKIILYKNLK